MVWSYSFLQSYIEGYFGEVVCVEKKIANVNVNINTSRWLSEFQKIAELTNQCIASACYDTAEKVKSGSLYHSLYL